VGILHVILQSTLKKHVLEAWRVSCAGDTEEMTVNG